MAIYFLKHVSLCSEKIDPFGAGRTLINTYVEELVPYIHTREF